MKTHNGAKLYWKDALRQVKSELVETGIPAPHHRWRSAYQQAQADLASPDAVIWLPDEIAEVIRQTRHAPDTPPPATPAKRLPWIALLLVALLLIPAAVGYLLACRRILPHHR